jgi:predicted transport protein
MKDLTRCIENLRAQIERHSHSGLKEYPTRTILIDPLLEALGWDIRDPDDVELEYPTVDGKSVDYAPARHEGRRADRGHGPVRDYSESHHTAGKPSEVVELYRALDKLCLDLAPAEVIRKHLAKYVAWAHEKHTFCCAHLQQSGLRVWLKLDPADIRGGPRFARDVSRIGHWGVGDVELAIDSMQRLREAENLIRASFESARRR